MTYIIFAMLFTLTIGSACVVAFSRNLVYAVFSLLGTFLGVAGTFVMLEADFAALTQVVVYAGGILVLMVFGVMLTARIDKNGRSNPMANLWISVPLVGILFVVLMLVVVKTHWDVKVVAEVLEGSVASIGQKLMGVYLLPFEIISVVLLLAMIGAAVVARRNVGRGNEHMSS